MSNTISLSGVDSFLAVLITYSPKGCDNLQRILSDSLRLFEMRSY